MQGLILAAGMGKRLKELTKDNTKCMVKVNGTTLAERTLRQLDGCNLNRIILVVGYEGKKLIDYVTSLNLKTPVMFIDNPIYDKTNNIYSLALAKEQLKEDDTLLLESDIIFEDGLLQSLIDDPRPSLALVDKYESWMDGTCVTLNDDDSIKGFISKADFNWDDADDYYKTVNIYKFSKEFSANSYVPFMTAYCETMGMNQYYEQVLKVIAMLGDKSIQARRLNGEVWYEIDDVQDLDIAESLFDDEEGRLKRVHARYGGFWRYPGMKDFCYLVNPFYPPKKLVDELKANFTTLLTQYPSGMAVNSLLAAKNFAVSKDHIVVGNGAAELIKALMETCEGKLGIVRPTFEEYPNRYDEREIEVFRPHTPGCRYTVDDLIGAFLSGESHVSNVLLVNPDNPSGNYIPVGDIKKFAKVCADKGVRLIVDESFADFADEADNTLIKEEIFAEFPELIVVKSISKSYGVPGLRLGVLASGNEGLISKLKKDVSIWNINSFAEYYMQIEGKYHSQYESGMEEFKKVRAKFVKELEQLPNVKVFPTQANFVMMELMNMSAHDLSKTLLSRYNILIKDLTSKMKGTDRQFVRLAVRDEADNGMLIDALKEIIH